MQDVKLLVEDIGALKPTIFCAVPRVLDRIYAGRIGNGLLFLLQQFDIYPPSYMPHTQAQHAQAQSNTDRAKDLPSNFKPFYVAPKL